MTNTKAIIIKSTNTKPGSLYEWSKIGDFIKEFTSGIQGQQIADSTGKGIGKIGLSQAISGLPSPMARADMFTYAIQYGHAGKNTSGLISFYESLLNEWKGIISSFVIAPSKIKVQRIYLNYTKGDMASGDRNLYEPKGAFGNILHYRTQLWEDQQKIGDKNRKPEPFVDLIKFDDQVVGSASPESLIFTSASYKINTEYSFIDKTTGRFTNPLQAKSKLSAPEMSALYAYIKRVIKKLPAFYNLYEGSKHLLPEGIDQKTAQILQDWLVEIEQVASEIGINLTDIKPSILIFDKSPFDQLFNSENVLYADIHGVIFEELKEISGYSLKFNPDHLLLDDKSTVMARIAGEDEYLQNAPVYFLRADYGQGKVFFSLPLSELGLKVFDRYMDKLLSENPSDGSSVLAASYRPKENLLDIQLELKSNGVLISKISKSYKCQTEAIDVQQVIIWPDFISRIWDKYYLFSEMPHDSNSWQIFPILGDNLAEEGVFPYIESSNESKYYSSEDSGFIRIAEAGRIKNEALGKILVGNIKTNNPYKYEIYESSKPYKGVEIRYRNNSSGFILVNYISGNKSSVKNKLSERSLPSPTRIGVDFGSNNTCIAFWNDIKQAPETLYMSNRRISLFSSDAFHNENNNFSPAKSFEMLFFQNDEVWSNKIKSYLTVHDETRLIKDNPADNIDLMIGEVVKGGFMCYEKNIAIVDSSFNRHKLSVKTSTGDDMGVSMVHNMKWSLDAKEQGYKRAFLKILLLQVYAELFMYPDKSFYPAELVWAYPSSMPGGAINDYSNNVWSKVVDCNPLKGNSSGTDFRLYVAPGQKRIDFIPKIINPSTPGTLPQQQSPFGGLPGKLPGGFGLPGPMGQQPSSQNKLELQVPDEAPVKIELMSPADFEACTESMAVANYASVKDNGANFPYVGNFILGFDVGGSTTDLLAITSITSPHGDTKPALIKQNSIKIAAGILADATGIVPGFSQMLNKFVLSNKLGTIYGLDKITPNTAPFYFNQIVDRLNGEDELNSFYKDISSNCKPLMWLNLYITGLTLYYAGMVSRKLRILTEQNLTVFAHPLQNLTIEFYGKGSRIFDWFKAVNPANAYDYYSYCFSYGYGINEAQTHFTGFKIGNFQSVNSSVQGNRPDEVKVEVAKGLAVKSGSSYGAGILGQANGVRGIAEAKTKIAEILGEDGYTLRIPGQTEPMVLDSLMDINPSLIQRLGGELLPPRGSSILYPRFTEFIQIYYQFCSQFNLSINLPELKQGIASINVVGELMNDEGYKQALNNKDGFDYVAPLFILQGQAFLRSFLMNRLK